MTYGWTASGSCVVLRRASDERRIDAGIGKIAHEVVDVALEPAEAVQREHGSGDDGDAEHGSDHGICEGFYRFAIFLELSTLEIQRFDSLHDRSGIERRLDVARSFGPQPSAQCLVVCKPADVVGQAATVSPTGVRFHRA